jgi:hypothetical protein
MIQHEENLDAINAKYERQRKSMCLKTAITTGAIVASSTISISESKPEVMLLTLASLAIANSVYDLYIKHKNLKPYKIDHTNLENIDYRKLAKSNRELDRYNGKLRNIAPYRFELENKEEIEEEFGYQSDNDLPIHFLEQELVPSRVLHEYELYAKRYEVPTLNISEEVFTNFVNKLSNLLKKVNMSHRIYYYTSEYMKRLITLGIINYWEEITLDTLLDHIDIFEQIDISKESIESFKQEFKEEKTKKLK